jgi:drug/metabolite transporter (DMT)-like permease
MAISHPGETAALATALCWSVSSVSLSAAARRAGSLTVNLIRLAMAFAFLALYGLLVRGRGFPSDATPRAWSWLALSGLIGFFLGDLCLLKAMILIGPRLSQLLMSLAPPMAAVAGLLFLDEELRGWSWLGMVVTLAGVCWVVLERPRAGEEAPDPRPIRYGQGLLLGVLAAAGQAIGAVLSKYGMGDYDAFAATQIRGLTGFACFAVLLAVLGWYPRVMETLREPRVMGHIALGAFLGPFLGVGLFLLSLQHIATGVAQTIVSVTPVLVIPLVMVVEKERVSLRAVAGALVAVLGVGILLWP